MSVNLPTPIPGATSVPINAKDVVRIAVVAVLAVLTLETVAALGGPDWRVIPDKIAGVLRPPPATTTTTTTTEAP